ncbi:YbjQ family protein [Halanaerobacter jeridensis]|uniref:UPF0145 protein JOC47_002432 n=1 Tax=Halanaerobacter jeridensis TaxID=706427 RepID=A0A938XTQ1_9FIRM|nr:YbjQ family protein [Halanaerobacter jeridensis]MBM7557566.1 uncharacterized protein YbjQ (UPF0145 family) [Halanaerobacter jeridensis]
MLITNNDQIPEQEISQNLGLVKGNTIRAKHLGNDILAALRNLIGGEVKGYTKMISEARNQAIERMKKEASRKDADAVINVRFTTSQVMSGAAEILVYGTAVKLKPNSS